MSRKRGRKCWSIVSSISLENGVNQNYNSVVATFCNAVANELEYTVINRETELELLYIDDLIEEMFDALEGKEHCDGRYCYVPSQELTA